MNPVRYQDWRDFHKHQKSVGFGTLIKTAIHATLNWIERIPRRSRYRLGFVVRLLSCTVCNGRQVWIDRHVALPRWRWLERLL